MGDSTLNILIIAPMTRESLDVASRLLDISREHKSYAFWFTCSHVAYLDMSDVKPAHYVCRCNRPEGHHGPHAMFTDKATSGELKAIWPNEAEAQE